MSCPVNVPEKYRSNTPERLRHLAQQDEVKIGSEDQKILVDAAAEIEGGEEAYAVLVSQIRDLREKLNRTELNLRAALDLVPRKQI